MRKKRHVNADGKRPQIEFEKQFRELVDRWKEESLLMSSPTDMASLPSYLQIIAMGKKAVPLLLQELEREPDHLFRALTVITGQDAVPPSVAGDLKAMTAAWLKWGRTQGYLQPRVRRVS